jgi:hypothetical protein
VPATPGATPGPQGRGFILTINGTTPISNAAQFLEETIVDALRNKLGKDKIPADKKYYVDRVEVVYLRPLRENNAKLSALKTQFDSAVQAKLNGTFNAASSGFTGAGGFGGGPPEMEGGGAGFGGGFNPGAFGGANPGAAAAAAADQDRAFKDRNFPTEDIRDDQEFIAVATVVLEPPPKPPGEAAAAPGAAAPGAAAPGAAAPAAPAEGAATPATQPTEGATPATPPAEGAAPAAPATTEPAAPATPAPAPATPAAPQ